MSDLSATPVHSAGTAPGNEDEVEALLAEQRRRWQAGQRVPAEDYLRLRPGVRADAERALDLVYGEFLLREELGETPTLEEFTRRFPEYAEALRVQVELHRAVPTDGWEDDDALAQASDLLTEESDPQPAPPGYEVLGELGRGGMGVVYQARQASLGRLVALKVILAGAHADADQQRRFRAEAEAVARLHHPNVVQVYDHGVSDGCPYLVLEYVEGGTLAQKVAGNPQPAGEAARTVETLAAAVHHAHLAGLVHRDLKPANVLLTAEGVLKITDFGLVKRLHGEPGASTGEPGALATGGHTQTGALVGTPAYMAPEQVSGGRGAVGPAADVYALGVILYELLTGRLPFQGASALEVLRQVQDEEPRPPGRLRPGLPRDLETVCLKCLHKDPARRYAGAAALADDLRRFQAGEPIAARPVGLAERAWRWCRRKPALAGLAAALVLVAAVSLGTLTGLWLRAEHALDRADADFRLACEAIDRHAVRVSENLRLRQEDLRPLRKELLESVVPFYERLLERHGGRADLRAERGRAFRRLAEIVEDIDDLLKAGELYGQAAEVFRELADQDPGDEEYQTHLAHLGTNLGGVSWRTGRTAQAEASYQDSLKRWREIAHRQPGTADSAVGLARSQIGLAGLYASTGRRDQALDLYKQALRISEELAQGGLLEPTQQQVFALAHHDLGRLYHRLGRTPEAESELDQALHVQERLVAANRQVSDYQHRLAAVRRSRAELLQTCGRLVEARVELGTALQLADELARQHPSVHDYAESLAGCRLALAGVTASKQETSEALGEFEKVRDVLEEVARRQPRVVAHQERLVRIHEHLSLCYQTIGRWEEATAAAEKALSVLEPLIERQPEVDAYQGQRCGLYSALARIHIVSRQYDAAEAPLARALELGQSLVRQHPEIGAYQKELASSSRLLGHSRFETRRLKEVEPPFQQALKLTNDLVRRYPAVLAYHVNMAQDNNNLGVYYQFVARRDEAAAAYARAVELTEHLAERQPDVIDYAVNLGGYRANLAYLEHDLGRFESGVELFTSAIAVLQPVVEREPKNVRARLWLCDAHWNRAGTLGALNCWPEAVADYSRTLELDDGRRRETILAVRADARARAGDYAPAMAEVRELAGQEFLKSADNYYKLAWACCAAAEAVSADETLTTTERGGRAEEYAALGVALLVRGEAAGYFKDAKNVEELKTDAYLDRLRARADFRSLLATVEAGTNRKNP